MSDSNAQFIQEERGYSCHEHGWKHMQLKHIQGGEWECVECEREKAEQRISELEASLAKVEEGFAERGRVIERLEAELKAAKEQLALARDASQERERELILAAIEQEPELPGDMPEDMWSLIQNDRDAATQALRIIVRQTKQGIREHYLRTREEK